MATSPDMLKLWYNLLSGAYLPHEEVHKMLDPLYPSPDEALWFGRGIMVYQVPNEVGRAHTWVGHSGGITGHQASVATKGVVATT